MYLSNYIISTSKIKRIAMLWCLGLIHTKIVIMYVGVTLFILKKNPGGTFIQGNKFIRESRVLIFWHFCQSQNIIILAVIVSSNSDWKMINGTILAKKLTFNKPFTIFAQSSSELVLKIAHE